MTTPPLRLIRILPAIVVLLALAAPMLGPVVTGSGPTRAGVLAQDTLDRDSDGIADQDDSCPDDPDASCQDDAGARGAEQAPPTVPDGDGIADEPVSAATTDEQSMVQSSSQFQGTHATRTPKPTRTAIPTKTTAPTQAPKPSKTPVPTRTAKPTRTPKPTKTTAPTKTPVPTRTSVPTKTTRPTQTPVPSRTATPSRTAIPTRTPSQTAMASATQVLTETPAVPPTHAPTETPTSVPTESPTDIPAETATSTSTDSATSTPTETSTQTPTDTPTDTSTYTPSNTPTMTPTPSPALCSEIVTASLEPGGGPQLPPTLYLEASAESPCGHPLAYFWTCQGTNSMSCANFLDAASTGRVSSYEFPLQPGDTFNIGVRVCSVGPTVECANLITASYDGADIEIPPTEIPTSGPTNTPAMTPTPCAESIDLDLQPGGGTYPPPFIYLRASGTSACGYPVRYVWTCEGPASACTDLFVASYNNRGMTSYDFPIESGQQFTIILRACSDGPTETCTSNIMNTYVGGDTSVTAIPSPTPTSTATAPPAPCYELLVSADLQPGGGEFLPQAIHLQGNGTSPCGYPLTYYWMCVGTNQAACDSLLAANGDQQLREFDLPVGDGEHYLVGLRVCSFGQWRTCSGQVVQKYDGQAYRSPTPTPTYGPSLTPTQTPTSTPSLTPAPSFTPTITPSPTQTLTPSVTPTGCQERVDVVWIPGSGPQISPTLYLEWNVTSFCGYDLTLAWTCDGPGAQACNDFLAAVGNQAVGTYDFPLGLNHQYDFELKVCSAGPTQTCTGTIRQSYVGV